MSRLSLVCFGSFQAMLAGERLTGFHSVKVQALLAYLVLEADRPHAREALATLLWPLDSESSARNSLRQALYELRKLLGDRDDIATPFLLVTRQTVQFNSASAYLLDTADFLAAIQQGHLERAAALYRGDLLSGLSCESEPFEDWLRLTRVRFHNLAVDLLFKLTEQALKQGDLGQARRYAQQQLALEPWREEAHRQLMTAFALSGERSAALAQYETCRRILAAELQVTPDSATQSLYDEIRSSSGFARDVKPPTQPANAIAPPLVSASPRYDWGEMPRVDAFYGRRTELAQLTAWLTQERCRLVVILAMGGQGKTMLAAQLLHELTQHTVRSATQPAPFERLLWRSLLNAPPLNEIMATWLRFLSDQTVTDIPMSLDAQLTLLIDLLRQRRALLVLDNAESILRAGDDEARAGAFRAGYEDYGQLLQRVGQSDHQSCLILTSRELPYGVARLARDTRLVQTLPLAGIDTDAGEAIMHGQGLTGTGAQFQQLLNRYSGNPLALKLISETVQDYFAGDIGAFLQEEPLLFDDIRDVLDQQFARLSPLERSILFWLAIERTEISAQVLRANLLEAPPLRALLEALGSLQRRSLVMQGEAGFTLQNVVTEYVTDRLTQAIAQELTGGDLRLFTTHALLKAQAKEYVRQSQARLLLQPIVAALTARWGLNGFAPRLQQLIPSLRTQPTLAHSYAVGNLINLLLQQGAKLNNADFSRLAVWQAYLRQVDLPGVDFTGADLTGSVFIDTFSTVKSLAISPDGELLAAGTGNGELRLWRLRSGQSLTIMRGHTRSVWGLAFRPDGALLASGSADLTIRLWRVDADGQLQALSTLHGHTGSINGLAFSPDGQILASASDDGTACVWSLHPQPSTVPPSPPARLTLRDHTAIVWSVAFHPTQPLLASGSYDHTVRLWHAHTGQLVASLAGHTGFVQGIAFSADGQSLASASTDRTVRLWDIRELGQGEVPCDVLEGHADWVCAVVFNPQDKTLASSSDDQTIRLWKAQTGQILHTLHAHTHFVRPLAFTPDGRMLVSGSEDRTIRLWDAQTGQPLHTLQGYTNWVRPIAFCPAAPAASGSTRRLFASGSDDLAIRLWDVAQDQPRHTLFGHTSSILALAFSPDGLVLASGSRDQTIRLWDVRGGQALANLPVLRGHSERVYAVAFSPDGACLASGGGDCTIRLWNIQTGECLQIWREHSNRVYGIAFSPPSADGALLLASVSADHTVRLWNVQSGHCLQTLHGHTERVYGVAFSPDGKLLATGGADFTVRLWWVESGELVAVLQGYTQTIYSLAFRTQPLDDAYLLASSGDDPTIRLWTIDGAGGRLHQTLTGHTLTVRTVVFSPEGDLLVSGSADETIRLWQVETGACVSCLRTARPYAGMKITGATGITPAQRISLKTLGAIDEEE